MTNSTATKPAKATKAKAPKAQKGIYLHLSDEAKAALAEVEAAGLNPSTIASKAILNHTRSEEFAQAVAVLAG
jgi:hypothetical protein